MTADVLALSIPLVAVVLGMMAGMLATWTTHRRKQQLMEQVHKERLVAIERGVPPPDLPNWVLDDAPSGVRALRSGIVMILVGLVLYWALYRAIDEDLALFGLIPVAVGIGNLFLAWILSRKQAGPSAMT